MRRPWQIWLVFSVALAAVVAATGWLSYKAIQADRAEQMARAQAALEESARLALWRMDSFVAPLLAQEIARSEELYGVNRVLLPSDWDTPETQPYNLAPRPREALAMRRTPPLVRLYFEIGSDGAVNSQQGPIEERDVVYARNAPLMDTLREKAITLYTSVRAADRVVTQDAKEQQYSQSDRGQAEYQARKRSVEQSNIFSQTVNQEPRLSNLPLGPDDRVGIMTPMWLSDYLMLVRWANVSRPIPLSNGFATKRVIQGCVLDWQELKRQLLSEVDDLLPAADLKPVGSDSRAPETRLMASLPVQLIPGPVPAATSSGLSPIQFSLLVTWGALALAIAAVAVLLHGVISLSERRGAFVSAVTHELRTPLTTFRMYAEMLSENMVPDEADRRRYLETLRVEADRLTHLVANVLAYARLERGRAGGRIETVTVERLLEVATQRLADRAAQSGLNLSIEVDGDTQHAEVRADPSAVEQILFNLVDNACKYAAGATDRALHLSATVEHIAVQIRLRDHGPGISPTEERRLFQPFRKSARDAAQSAPGVGLGLALCRRLAREMGGDLRYDSRGGGASFVLTLPKA